MIIFKLVTAIALGYLLGAIPCAYLAGRLVKGVDIRRVGGGNVGTLNTLREIGLVPGLLVLLLDVSKGSLSVLIARWLGLEVVWVFAAGFAAIVGHNWPVFLRFQGGKGAATTLGVLLPLAPIQFAISLGVMLVLIVITSNIRLAVVVGLALLPLIIWLFHGPPMVIYYTIALTLFLILRSLPGVRREMARAGDKKGIVVDKKHHFWQARKNR